MSITSLINILIKEPLNSGKDSSYSHFPDLTLDFFNYLMHDEFCFKSEEALLRKPQRSKTTVSKGVGVFFFLKYACKMSSDTLQIYFFSLLKCYALLGAFAVSGTEQVLLCFFIDFPFCCRVCLCSINAQVHTVIHEWSQVVGKQGIASPAICIGWRQA